LSSAVPAKLLYKYCSPDPRRRRLVSSSAFYVRNIQISPPAEYELYKLFLNWTRSWHWVVTRRTRWSKYFAPQTVPTNVNWWIIDNKMPSYKKFVLTTRNRLLYKHKTNVSYIVHQLTSINLLGRTDVVILGFTYMTRRSRNLMGSLIVKLIVFKKT